MTIIFQILDPTRNSAVAENRATHLCKCNDVVDSYKHAPPHKCYHAKFGRSEPPKLGSAAWNSALLGWEAWLTPRYMPNPHMCYHVKFGSSASKSMQNRTEPPVLGRVGLLPLAVWTWLTPRNTPLPTCYRCAECDRSRSNDTSIIKEIRQKNLTPRVPPFKVTQGHWNRQGSIL